MRETRKLNRLRRYMALALSFTTLVPSAEAAWGRSRRSKMFCGAVLLGAAVTTSQWWNAPPSGNASTTEVQRHGGMEMYFHFKTQDRQNTEVRGFVSGWINHAVASRVKQKIAAEFPQAADFPGWEDPGLRVPISYMSFVPVEGQPDQVRVSLAGPFLQLFSKQPLQMTDLQRGGEFTADFEHQREDEFKQGLNIRFQFQFRMDPNLGSIESAQLKGRFHAFGPYFSHSDEFSTGPWIAEPPKQVARQ